MKAVRVACYGCDKQAIVEDHRLAAVVSDVKGDEVQKIVGRHGRRHPATQVFQALRMEVNDELGALEEGLRVITSRLELGARIAVISFHSLEDRMVKNFFRDRSREYVDRPEWPEPRENVARDLVVITPKPIEPGENEQRFNPRARSAKLRVAEKLR